MANQEITSSDETGQSAGREAQSQLPAVNLLANLPNYPTDGEVEHLVEVMVDTSFPQLAETKQDVRESLFARREQAESEYSRLTNRQFTESVHPAGPEQLLPLLIQSQTAQRNLLALDIAENRFNLAMHRSEQVRQRSGASSDEILSALAAPRAAYLIVGEEAFRANPQVFRQSAGSRLKAQTEPRSLKAAVISGPIAR